MYYKELLQQIKEFLSACEQMRYGEYVGAPWPYNHDGPMVYTEPDAVLLGLASNAITDLLARAEAAEAAQESLQRAMAEYKARAGKAERERDAAVFDLLRAEEAAEETNALLDDEVHPACDYSLYLAVHDSVSDIVNWERDDVWRGPKEG